MVTTAVLDFDEFFNVYHQAVAEFVKGDPEPLKNLFSRRKDVSLAHAFGGIMRGWRAVSEAEERAAAIYREGTASFENVVRYVTPDFAYVVEFEDYKAKLGGRPDASEVSLRITSIFRLEDGAWKLAHRHADPLITPQSTETVIKDKLCIGSRCYF